MACTFKFAQSFSSVVLYHCSTSFGKRTDSTHFNSAPALSKLSLDVIVLAVEVRLVIGSSIHWGLPVAGPKSMLFLTFVAIPTDSPTLPRREHLQQVPSESSYARIRCTQSWIELSYSKSASIRQHSSASQNLNGPSCLKMFRSSSH